MKKTQWISVLAVGMLVTNNALAQVDFSIGPKVGASYVDFVSPNDLIKTEPTLGYQAGIFTRLGFGILYFQPEANFSVKGSKIRVVSASGDENPDDNLRVDFNNVDVPVLVGLKLVNEEKFNLRIFGGPLASFVIDVKENGVAQSVPSPREYADNTWGAQMGVGFDIGSFTIDGRYEVGLSEIDRFYDQKASIFMLSLGLKLF